VVELLSDHADIDKDDVISRMRPLVEEYEVPISEARRSTLNSLLKSRSRAFIQASTLIIDPLHRIATFRGTQRLIPRQRSPWKSYPGRPRLH